MTSTILPAGNDFSTHAIVPGLEFQWLNGHGAVRLGLRHASRGAMNAYHNITLSLMQQRQGRPFYLLSDFASDALVVTPYLRKQLDAVRVSAGQLGIRGRGAWLLCADLQHRYILGIARMMMRPRIAGFHEHLFTNEDAAHAWLLEDH